MAKKSKGRYCVYVQHGRKKEATGECFNTKKKATTFANIETSAGMGESYFVKDKKKKRFIA